MSIIGTLRQSPRRTILVANELRADIVRDGREMARSRMTQQRHWPRQRTSAQSCFQPLISV
jgi:hypothetical protein